MTIKVCANLGASESAREGDKLHRFSSIIGTIMLTVARGMENRPI